MGAFNSKEEEPVAKKRRLEPPNASEQIIQLQKQVIERQEKELESFRAEIVRKSKRIQELEDQIKQESLESLPNECLWKIMSYLSNHDLLRNIAPVSKRFYKLSQDQRLIRKIVVDSETWEKIPQGKCTEDLLNVLKRSLKLTSFSFDFGIHSSAGERFLQALYMMNHQFLQELCIKGDARYELFYATVFLSESPGNPGNLLKYLEVCPKLKVLRFEFKPQSKSDWEELKHPLSLPFLSWIQETISNIKHKNLQEFHLNGLELDLHKQVFKKLLETIAGNMPKLQFLCLTVQLSEPDVHGEWDEFDKICRGFVSEKNIRLEIRDVPVLCNFDGGVKSICCGHYKVHPSKVVRIYDPK